MDLNEILGILIKAAIKVARDITDDQEALGFKCLYKELEAQKGRILKEGEYVQYNNNLYRVLEEHVVTEFSPSLFHLIEPNEG